MELGTIRQINIDVEMQASYLDYAMSVIVARALPDVRDGLKPVHRRILYAMHDLGLTYDKPYKKSARIVGEVLGKYHPHGDAAVYEAMVRMAQDFSLRYPLVDGQGNFGSIDGDNAAAMRYTEARLSRIAHEMLADIEKDTVDWTDNFDGTLKEPSVLPSALPNLLVNGSSGIAVGMATNIPPHNLGEVCDALGYLIDHFDHHDDVTVEDLMRFIPGPDFPTGGVVYRYATEGSGDAAEQVDVIAHAYAGGKGAIIMQAKAHIEEMSRSKNRIVVTELPYQTNKTNLLERIADLVRDGRLEGITDLRDESDRTGMRICVELTRTVDPRQVLADLFKLTPLQQTFGVSLLALVADESGRLEPRLLSLKRMLMHYIEHRQEVIVRRSKHDLERARQRAHILEGLLRALDVLDEIIALIRRSSSADDARQGLIKQFQFSELQAQAILDLQLRRLAALERQKLKEEHKQLLALIKELEALLKSPQKVLALIRDNLIDLKAKYADARRTQIADRVQGILTTHDLLPDEEVWVGLGADGMLTRQGRYLAEKSEYGTVSVWETPPIDPRATTATLHIAAANTRDDLYLFSAKGQVTRLSVHQIPENGGHFADLSGFNRRDRVAAMIALPKGDTASGAAAMPSTAMLLLGTAQGKVKRVALADLLDQGTTNPQVIGLDEGDDLLWVALSSGGGEFLLVTAQGQAIRFGEEHVRAMGLPAGGIGGIKLGAKDRVVAGMAPTQSPNQPIYLAVVTSACFAKRVPLADFPSQGRNGQGVVAAKLTDKSGEIVGAALLTAAGGLVCLTSAGTAKMLPASDIAEMGRPSQGKQALELAKGELVLGAFAVGAAASDGGRRQDDGGGWEDDRDGEALVAPVSKVAPATAAKPPSGKAKADGKAVKPAVEKIKAPASAGGAASAGVRGGAKTAAGTKSPAPKAGPPPGKAKAVTPTRSTGSAGAAAGAKTVASAKPPVPKASPPPGKTKAAAPPGATGSAGMIAGAKPPEGTAPPRARAKVEPPPAKPARSAAKPTPSAEQPSLIPMPPETATSDGGSKPKPGKK